MKAILAGAMVALAVLGAQAHVGALAQADPTEEPAPLQNNNITALANLGDAVGNQVVLTLDALYGRATASNCQLLVAGDITIGATGTTDALALLPASSARAPLAIQQIDQPRSDATSRCVQTVATIRMEIARSTGWGEPAPEEAGFWPLSTVEPPTSADIPVPELGPLTIAATATSGDIGANNATIMILSGGANAASSCQIVVAAGMILTALAVVGAEPLEAREMSPAENNGLTPPGAASATCRQHIGTAELTVPG